MKLSKLYSIRLLNVYHMPKYSDEQERERLTIRVHGLGGKKPLSHKVSTQVEAL